MSATLKPAGLDIAKDIISTNCGKDPGDPQWKDDPGLKADFAFIDKPRRSCGALHRLIFALLP